MGSHRMATPPAPPRYDGVHRKPAPYADLVQAAALGLGATVMVGGVLVSLESPVAAATSDDFQRLRFCESSDNYQTDTGNGYYGAYQFDLQTWQGLGYSGYPSSASPDTQDQAAVQLYEARGWEPWPACSQQLGLVDDRAGGADRANRGVTRAPLPGGAPDFPGALLTTAMVGEQRTDVYRWQAQMARRGWPIGVDGYFGPQSASIAAAFEAEKGVSDGLPGQVGASVWGAAWTAPIT